MIEPLPAQVARDVRPRAPDDGRVTTPQLVDQADADAFAAAWVSAWNAHDLDAIVSHYAPEVEFVSPMADRVTGHPVVRGTAALRAYFAAGLERFPDLAFELSAVLVGSGSVTLDYRSVSALRCLETMVLDDDGLVVQARAHYAPLLAQPSTGV